MNYFVDDLYDNNLCNVDDLYDNNLCNQKDASTGESYVSTMYRIALILLALAIRFDQYKLNDKLSAAAERAATSILRANCDEHLSSHGACSLARNAF